MQLTHSALSRCVFQILQRAFDAIGLNSLGGIKATCSLTAFATLLVAHPRYNCDTSITAERHYLQGEPHMIKPVLFIHGTYRTSLTWPQASSPSTLKNHVVKVDGSLWTSIGGPLATLLVLDGVENAMAK